MSNPTASKLQQTFWSVYAIVYDTLLVFRPYRKMVEDVVQRLALTPGARVLDAGCGTGNVTQGLVRAGYRVVAADLAGGMLKRAGDKNPAADVRSVDLNATLPFEDEQFDGLTCSNVLYSLSQPVRSLVELRRILKPGGRLVLTNPRRDFSMFQIMREHWSGGSLAEKLSLLLALPRIALLIASNLFLLDPERKAHFYFPRPEELQLVLERIGFEQVEYRPCYGGQGFLYVARKSAAAGSNLPTCDDLAEARNS